MKHSITLLVIIITFLSYGITYGQKQESKNKKNKYTVEKIVHPGTLHSLDDLDYIKKHVNDSDEPWASAYKKMLAWKGSSLDWEPTPFKHVHRDSYGANRVGDPAISNDGSSAYSHALQWYITGDTAHAEKTITILNAWANTIETITGKDDNLIAGMLAQKYCNAAEIIRYTYDKWPQQEIEQFENMLMTVFYPLISNYYTNSMNSNGNWGLSMVNSVMTIAVFCDDVDLFNNAIAHVTGTERQPYSTFSGYIDAETGQCQESGRDQGHPQMGLGYLGAICEIAWKQGIDLYSYLDNRLLHGLEYHAKYNLGYDVPYYNMYGKYKDTIATKNRGKFDFIYERAYNHYVNRQHLSMPYTKQVIEKIRPEGYTSSMTSWGTLTSYHD